MSVRLGRGTATFGLALALATSAAAGVASPASAAPSSAASSAASSVTAASSSTAIHKVRLYELTTKGGEGFFYTADRQELEQAVSKHGMQVTQTPLYYISRTAFPGGKPMWRLRYTAKSSYLVTTSPQERDQLVGSGKFVNDGILGYAAGDGCAAGTTRVWRLSNNNKWRLAVESHMVSIVNNEPGWKLDGLALNHFMS
ncbi:hypothetical protein OHB01_20050 [Microbispora hainanensis]|uniref:hypothetical protein n=1 Tax=Microbispora hainanensis TaxID=568844 RepID=UPI002E29FA28|nr:hypothetical protein [Microbispora hainanensis]